MYLFTWFSFSAHASTPISLLKFRRHDTCLVSEVEKFKQVAVRSCCIDGPDGGSRNGSSREYKRRSCLPVRLVRSQAVN